MIVGAGKLLLTSLADIRFMTAYIEITRMCDLRCRHCYHKDNRCNPKMMDYEDYRKLVLSLFHTHHVKNFVILGGEPMLHPRVTDMIKFASEFGNVDICTNGRSAEKILPVAKYLRKYRVSLDGLRKDHDNIRGSGSYDRACAALMLLIKRGYYTSVTTTVHSENRDQILALVKRMDKIGVRDIQIQRLMNSEKTDGLRSLSSEEASKLGDQLDNLIFDLAIDVNFQKEKPVFRSDDVVNRLTIGPEGDVTFSPDKLGCNNYVVRFDFDLSMLVIDIDRLIKQT